MPPEKKRENFLNREAAEVYLLLDFLSGRADRSMSASPVELGRALLMEQATKATASDSPSPAEVAARLIEADLLDPIRLVLRAMTITYPLEAGSERFEADAAFLLRARDLLNSRAAPATGATIAFTWVVFRERLRRKAARPSLFSRAASWRRTAASNDKPVLPNDSSTEAAAEFADEAFPNYRAASHDLARQVRRIVFCTLPLLLIVVVFSAYAAWGRVLLNTIDAARKDFGAVEQSIESLESSRSPDTTADKAIVPADRYVMHFCDRPKVLPKLQTQSSNPEISIEQFDSAAQYHLCDRLDDVNKRMDQGYEHLAEWANLMLVWTGASPDEQWATAALSVLSNSILPVLYGLLGSMAFVLRRFHDRLASSLLTPRDQRANIIRLALGSLIGVTIGLFYNSSAETSQAAGVLGLAVNLSASALAFLAGYGVEAVFRILDAMLSSVFKINEHETSGNSVRT